MWNTWDSSVSCFTTIRTSLCIKVFYIDSSTVSVPNALITDIWSFFTNSALSWWLTIITQDIFSSTMFDIDQDSLCRVFFIFFTTTSFHLDVPLICTKLLCLSHITQNGFHAVVSWPSRNCGNVKSPDWQDSWQWGVGGGGQHFVRYSEFQIPPHIPTNISGPGISYEAKQQLKNLGPQLVNGLCGNRNFQ